MDCRLTMTQREALHSVFRKEAEVSALKEEVVREIIFGLSGDPATDQLQIMNLQRGEVRLIRPEPPTAPKLVEPAKDGGEQ